MQPHAPDARLLLAGAPAPHSPIDAVHDVTVTGYLETDEELTDHIAACDVSLHLRWPTARETSGPWLRALAAGKPTVITDLVHLTDVPSLDPRTWRTQGGGGRGSDDGHASLPPSADLRPPVCVAVDILDEDHSLRLAMRRLAVDAELRARLGQAGRAYWTREHSIDAMADDYDRIMREAASRPDPIVELPAHMRNPGDRRMKALLAPFGLEPRL